MKIVLSSSMPFIELFSILRLASWIALIGICTWHSCTNTWPWVFLCWIWYYINRTCWRSRLKQKIKTKKNPFSHLGELSVRNDVHTSHDDLQRSSMLAVVDAAYAAMLQYFLSGQGIVSKFGRGGVIVVSQRANSVALTQANGRAVPRHRLHWFWQSAVTVMSGVLQTPARAVHTLPASHGLGWFNFTPV